MGHILSARFSLFTIILRAALIAGAFVTGTFVCLWCLFWVISAIRNRRHHRG